MTKAPGTIIEAIAAGRRAASSIDKFLGGDGNIEETLVELSPLPSVNRKRQQGFADLKRVQINKIPVSERQGNFTEVELSFDDDQAIREAKRCLQCDMELNVSPHRKL